MAEGYWKFINQQVKQNIALRRKWRDRRVGVVAAPVEDAIDTSRCRLGALCPGCDECNTDRVAEPTEEATHGAHETA